MAISDLTGPYGDGERDEPVAGDAREEVLDTSDEGEAFDDGDDGDDGEADGFDDDSATFAEEEARENAEEVVFDDELPLVDEETRLPWLEGDEDEEDYAGYSSGQTIALIVAVLLVVGLVVGGIWWLSRSGPDADLVADGSTIQSEGPYKQRPDNPGGKVFDGTGDSSFKVSEGQTAPARLGQENAGPAPGFETLDKGDAGAKGETAKPAEATSSSAGAVDSASVGVQVGAYSSRAAAETGWSSLSQQHEALKGLRHRVVEGKADIGTVYRLQALAGDAAGAGALCGKLKASGLSCYVKR